MGDLHPGCFTPGRFALAWAIRTLDVLHPKRFTPTRDVSHPHGRFTKKWCETHRSELLWVRIALAGAKRPGPKRPGCESPTKGAKRPGANRPGCESPMRVRDAYRVRIVQGVKRLETHSNDPKHTFELALHKNHYKARP